MRELLMFRLLFFYDLNGLLQLSDNARDIKGIEFLGFFLTFLLVGLSFLLFVDFFFQKLGAMPLLSEEMSTHARESGVFGDGIIGSLTWLSEKFQFVHPQSLSPV